MDAGRKREVFLEANITENQEPYIAFLLQIIPLQTVRLRLLCVRPPFAYGEI